MSAHQNPPEDGSTERGPASDVYRAMLYAPSREAVAELLRRMTLDVGSMRVARGAKEAEVLLFITQDQANELKREGWNLEVYENLSVIGRERQKQVGKGDRFQGGKIPPQGLGKKTGKEK